MKAQFDTTDLTSAGLTDHEIQAVLAADTGEQQIRMLRVGRGRLLEDIHRQQRALDTLDYFIYQIKKSS